jgi:hypothetical protein
VRDVPEVVPLAVRVDDAPVAAVAVMVAVVVVVIVMVVMVVTVVVVVAPLVVVALVAVVVMAVVFVALVAVVVVMAVVVMAVMVMAVMVVTVMVAIVVVVVIVVADVVVVAVMVVAVMAEVVVVVVPARAHLERVDAPDLVAAVAVVRPVRDPAHRDVVAAVVHGQDRRRVVVRQRHVGQEVVAALERHLAGVQEFLSGQRGRSSALRCTHAKGADDVAAIREVLKVLG